MQTPGSAAHRNVLPRWRPLVRTPSEELQSALAKAQQSTLSIHVLDNALSKWQISGSTTDAIEVIDGAVVLGRTSMAFEPAKQLIAAGSTAVPSVKIAAKKVLGLLPDGPAPELATNSETHVREVRAAVRRLKLYLCDAPRDAISTVEIARLYALSGQREKAEAYVRRAAILAPNNRYVLRACARFFTFLGAGSEALKILWKSDAVRSDPWVQAAEIAVADASDRNPKWGPRGFKALSQANSVATSELAAAMATLEFKNSAKRKQVRKLLEQSLLHPSENVIAQALWLEEKASISVAAGSYLTEAIDNASEAQAFVAFEKGNYEEAAFRAKDWIADQPFQVRGFVNGNMVSSVYLNDQAEALRIGKLGESIHPSNWMLTNGIFVAAVFADDMAEAEIYLKKLEGFTSEPQAKPFIEAARGLIAYRSHDLMRGREHYLEAVAESSKLKKPDLVMNAYIFMLEQEARAGTLNVIELKEEVEHFEKRLGKLGPSDKKNVGRLWAKRRPIIERIVDEAPFKTSTFDSDISKIIRNILSQT